MNIYIFSLFGILLLPVAIVTIELDALKKSKNEKIGLIGFILAIATGTVPFLLGYIAMITADDSGFGGEFNVVGWTIFTFFISFIALLSATIPFLFKGIKDKKYKKFAIAGTIILCLLLLAFFYLLFSSGWISFALEIGFIILFSVTIPFLFKGIKEKKYKKFAIAGIIILCLLLLAFLYLFF
ncbi:MAG: hypothetical protein PHV47_01195 [Candidatus Pacebacteria bacterium]|nr:hypothetical protein [Candidatus Paceibacterota bacterium]